MDPVSIAAVGWGVSTAGWLISPIITKLLNKGFSYLGFLSSDKLKTLDTKVQQLKQMVEKVEASPHKNARLDQWMKDLKSAFYEVEDILDAIDYHHLKSRILYKSAKQKKQDFNIDPDSRGKLKKSIRSLENLVNEGELLSSVNLTANSDKMTNTPTIYKTAPTPPAVFGRDNDIQTIRGLLRDTPATGEPGSSTAKCYSVVGIHGLPGSGKTTLAQSVCKEERKFDYFNIVMWVHVSQNFTVEAVTSEMLEAASGKRCKLRNLGMLQEDLKKKLGGKKFLLVLDEFWHTDVRMLDTLLSPLIAGDSGSKILVTTRFEDVARALGAQNPFRIPEIDEDHFIKMFMHYALDDARNSDKKLKEYEIVGRDIARKLRRSPLAARIVAGQLRQRIDINHWRRTLDRDLLNDTLGVLRWSYQQLEEHVRQCFRYCIMFPRRYQLEREKLVHLWMAEGFVESPSGAEDMENIGHDCFDILLSCSFIQPGEHSIGMQYFTIHDLLHDLLEDWRPDFNVSRHAGSACYRIEEDFEAGELANYIMSYTTKTMTEKDLELLLKNLRKLRVVHVYCEGIKMIPECIGEQKHLRYLGLYRLDDYYGGGYTLPSTFTKLYHLQKFSSYPLYWVLDPSSHKEMGNLVNLRYMHGLEELNLAEIGRLTFLRTLRTFTVRKECGYEIHQLEHLDNLCGFLVIEGLQNVGSKEEARQAKLAKKVHLSELILQWKTEKQSSEENQDVRKSKKHRTISWLGGGASGSAVCE
ncbi:putative disease resistance protein RGA1, partial [Dichanthelium oligosanthes]